MANSLRLVLGIDLAGNAEDPFASRARSLLASRVVSLLAGLFMLAIGVVVIAEDWGTFVGATLIAIGLLRFMLLAADRRSFVYPLHSLSGALLVALGLVEIGTAGGLEAWGVLVLAIPPLLIRPQDGRAWWVIYGVSVGIVVVAEIMCQLVPPRAALPVDVLAGWRLVNFVGAALVMTALGFVYRKMLDRAEARVAEQQRVAQRLLANILPSPIAERLKREEYPIADAYEAATVMFADSVNFSEFAAHNSPATVVDLLNRLVYAFDDMAQQRGVEKIKTMGDGYMVAGGLTHTGNDAAAAVAEMAFEMLKFVHEFGRAEGLRIDLRIGINTGPLVAGVIGKHKFTYDVWGDTVNLAAHLERACEPGRVQISEATARALGPGWQVEPRGPIALKGHAPLSTYFLLGRAVPAVR